MSYKRKFYGGVLLDREEVKQNSKYQNIEIEYYKITNDKNTVFEGKRKTYGIELVMKKYIDNKIIRESEKIEALTKNERIIENVLEKLKENEVTPTTLSDVIEDLFN